MGVMSLTETRPMPLARNALMAASRPAPTPFIATDTSLIPYWVALSAINSPTLLAANGVPFLAPLKPNDPLDDHARIFPAISESITLVLLYVDCTCNKPALCRLRELLAVVFAPTATSPSLLVTIRFFPIFDMLLYYDYFFSNLRLPEPIVFRTLPLTVRELDLVR